VRQAGLKMYREFGVKEITNSSIVHEFSKDNVIKKGINQDLDI